MSIDLLDQDIPSQKKFKKNFILIPSAVLTLIAYLFHLMHWPGGTLFYIFFGALTCGFCFGLLFFNKQFSFNTNLGFIALPMVIIIKLIRFVNVYGLSLFGILCVIAILVSILILRKKQLQ